MNENDMVIKDARTLGLPKMLLLGLQHMFAMFGATILVPILVNTYFEGEGLSIQVTLMCAGLGTLFFHACSKLKVPAFLGSSFAFLGGFAICLRRYRGSGCAVPDSGADHQAGRRGARHALSAAGCDRSDHYLYRTFTGAVRDRQRIDKLADCVDRAGNHHRF